MHFAKKTLAEGLGPRRERCIVTYLFMRIHPKSENTPLKVRTTFLGGSSKGATGA